MAEGNDDVRAKIENAITILSTPAAQEPHAARRSIVLAIEALRAALGGLDEVEAELELVTSPERIAAGEVKRLQSELAEAKARAQKLDGELTKLKQKTEIEGHLHDEERKRLKDLERRAKDFDTIVLKDKDAFDQFMQRTLDRDDQKLKQRKERG
jgi:hypothetical protein